MHGLRRVILGVLLLFDRTLSCNCALLPCCPLPGASACITAAHTTLHQASRHLLCICTVGASIPTNYCLCLQVELKQDLVGSCVVGDVVTVLGLVKVLATGDTKTSGAPAALSSYKCSLLLSTHRLLHGHT